MKKFLFGVFVSAIFLACNDKKEAATPAEEKTAAVASEAKKQAPVEVLDISEADLAKAGYAAFAKGDIDGMTANFADTIRYLFSSGDSLIGKQAVKNYFVGRWKIIDSFMYSESIYLPIKANESQSQYAPIGKWVLAWNLANVKYKNGKWLHFWVHTDFHYNDAGKADLAIQYIDRRPIWEATKDLMK